MPTRPCRKTPTRDRIDQREENGLHFTVTNDDGYDANGIAVLARAARAFGTAEIVAPLTPQSQVSHAVSLNRPVGVRTIAADGPSPVRAVAGRPADCTRLALAGIAVDQPPDWVLSGINHGANLGIDLFYSGTAAAAREAALHGLPAISFSQLIKRPQPIDWDGATIMATRALRALLARGCPTGTFYNVNLPALAAGFEQVPIIETRVAGDPLVLGYQPVEPPADADSVAAGCSYFRHAGAYMDRPHAAGTDIDVAFGGRISLSQVTIQVR